MVTEWEQMEAVVRLNRDAVRNAASEAVRDSARRPRALHRAAELAVSQGKGEHQWGVSEPWKSIAPRSSSEPRMQRVPSGYERGRRAIVGGA